VPEFILIMPKATNTMKPSHQHRPSEKETKDEKKHELPVKKKRKHRNQPPTPVESESSSSGSSEGSSEEEENDDEEDSGEEKKKASSARKAKRTQPPPLPLNGNAYFFIMLFLIFGTIFMLFWAFWIMNSGTSFVFMIAINFVVVTALIIGYRTVIYDKFKDFAALWYDPAQPIERKMSSIITVTTTNTWLQFVISLVGHIASITLIFSLPSVVIQSDIYAILASMPVQEKIIFSFLLTTCGLTVFFSWALNYALLYAVFRGCVQLEANHFDRLISQRQKRAAGLQAASPPVINPPGTSIV